MEMISSGLPLYMPPLWLAAMLNVNSQPIRVRALDSALYIAPPMCAAELPVKVQPVRVALLW